MPDLFDSPEQLSEDAARFLAIGRCADGIRHFAAELHGPDQITAGMTTALVSAMPQRNRRPLLPSEARLLRIGWQHELAARLGGVILLILAIEMVVGQGQASGRLTEGKDPMQLAQVPLAVPYLLNPVGIVGLMTISAEARSVRVLAAEIAVLVFVLLLDLVVFRWAARVGQTLNEDRMLVVEKIFGFLLAAVAVQLVLDGLASVGVIPL